jgi:hypothetical protein
LQFESLVGWLLLQKNSFFTLQPPNLPKARVDWEGQGLSEEAPSVFVCSFLSKPSSGLPKQTAEEVPYGHDFAIGNNIAPGDGQT